MGSGENILHQENGANFLNKTKLDYEAIIAMQRLALLAQSEANRCKAEYEKSLRDRLIGHKFIVTGRVESEELYGQDGYEWYRSSRLLDSAEVTVDRVFVTPTRSSNREESPFLYLGVIGNERDLVGVRLLTLRQFDPIEQERTDSVKLLSETALKSSDISS